MDYKTEKHSCNCILYDLVLTIRLCLQCVCFCFFKKSFHFILLEARCFIDLEQQ